MWLKDKKYLKQIKPWWDEIEFLASKLFQASSKMKIIKQKLKEWNSKFFGNIFKGNLTLEEKLASLNNEFMQHGMGEIQSLKEKEKTYETI